MQKKILMIAAVLLMVAVIVPALAVNSGDERGSAVLYENKYVPVTHTTTIDEVSGLMMIHTGTSALTHNVNNLDLWNPDVYISNVRDPQHREMKIELGGDGTHTELLIPGDFIVRYRYCNIPAKIGAGQNTFVDLPECDR